MPYPGFARNTARQSAAIGRSATFIAIDSHLTNWDHCDKDWSLDRPYKSVVRSYHIFFPRHALVRAKKIADKFGGSCGSNCVEASSRLHLHRHRNTQTLFSHPLWNWAAEVRPMITTLILFLTAFELGLLLRRTLGGKLGIRLDFLFMERIEHASSFQVNEAPGYGRTYFNVTRMLGKFAFVRFGYLALEATFAE